MMCCSVKQWLVNESRKPQTPQLKHAEFTSNTLTSELPPSQKKFCYNLNGLTNQIYSSFRRPCMGCMALILSTECVIKLPVLGFNCIHWGLTTMYSHGFSGIEIPIHRSVLQICTHGKAKLYIVVTSSWPVHRIHMIIELFMVINGELPTVY